MPVCEFKARFYSIRWIQAERGSQILLAPLLIIYHFGGVRGEATFSFRLLLYYT